MGLFYREQTFIRTKSCSFQVKNKRFTADYLKDNSQHMEFAWRCRRFAEIKGSWTIYKFDILDLAWLKMANFRLNSENVFVKYGFFICFLFWRLSWICPQLFLNLIIRWKLKNIIKSSSPKISHSNNYLSWFLFGFRRNVPKIPIIILQSIFQFLGFCKC